MSEPILLAWSGGKDSALALRELRLSSRFDAAGLLVTVTDGYDRVSMHGVRRELVALQAERVGLPLHEVSISSAAGNAEYETAMLAALQPFREHGVRRVAFGDLFLEDIRAYRERLLERADMEAVFPVWGRETRALAKEFVAAGFRAHLCCIDPRQLDSSFVGHTFDGSFLHDLPPSVDPCGENGEFHTFVAAGPVFDEPIATRLGEVVERDGFVFQDLIPLNEDSP